MPQRENKGEQGASKAAQEGMARTLKAAVRVLMQQSP
jgi:hypothetical protein